MGERRRHNLRAQPTPLIGRRAELELAGQILLRDNVRLITLTGVAGTGKTRLALALAASVLDVFPDGVYFVDLTRITDPALVTSSIADALGVGKTPGESALERLESALSERRSLLVLDNFEHLLPAADQVADLLAVCADLKIVVTSRASLQLRWEHVFPVGPLQLVDPSAGSDVERVRESPAVQLFVERARSADPTFEMTHSNAPVLAQICARLDGIPLAIELAAPRARHLPLTALLARLNRRLDLLVDGARDLPVRHRTLREAIAYSYDLLCPDERMLFTRVAVFAAGCTPEAAITVLAEAPDSGSAMRVTDGLESLVDKSLLRRERLTDGAVRFHMLETVREYALTQLESSQALTDLQSRLIDYLVVFARESHCALFGRDQLKALDMLEREHDNFRCALRWCVDTEDTERGLTLAAAMWRFWTLRGFVAEGRAWLDEVLALPRATSRTLLRANALSAAGDLAYHQGDDAAAEALQSESLSIRQELVDRHGVAASMNTLGAVAARRGDNDRARALCEESLLLARECQDRWGTAAALHHLGEIAGVQGHYSAARARYEDSLLEWLELGDKFSVATILESFAALAHARGQSPRALRILAATDVLRERQGVPGLSPVQVLELQRLRQSAEDAIGRERAEVAIAEGRGMDLDATVSYARGGEEASASTAPKSAVGLPAQGPLAWLTPREREVAALLLRGLSNRHIAEELVITERTAETHVCRILSKLGLDSRAQIAAWIIDNGLMDTRTRLAS